MFGCFSLIICWVEIKLFEFTKSPFPPVTRHRHKELSELFSFTTRICKNNSRNSLFFEILLYLWHVLNQAVKLTLKSNSVNFLGNEIIVDRERESNLNSIPSRIILDRIRPRPIYPPTWRQIPKQPDNYEIESQRQRDYIGWNWTLPPCFRQYGTDLKRIRHPGSWKYQKHICFLENDQIPK